MPAYGGGVAFAHDAAHPEEKNAVVERAAFDRSLGTVVGD
jgi:hypothetical protein